MKAVKNNWLAFAIMAALAGGCGDTAASNDGDNTGGGNGATAGTNNGGTGSGTTGGNAGGNTGDTGGTNTGGTGGTDNGGTAGANTGAGDGDGGPGGGPTGGANLPAASECGYETNGPKDTSMMGGCYYFYCYQTEASLRAAATTGGCANDKDVAIQCEGESVRTVAQCARDNAIALAANNKKVVVDCARKNAKLADLSDACLNCNVDSSYCAAVNCYGACIGGDSEACDKCREDNGCTPDFYACAGLPDPNM